MAAAIRQGADRLYASLDDPREGTILTVAREAAAAAERAAAVDSPTSANSCAGCSARAKWPWPTRPS